MYRHLRICPVGVSNTAPPTDACSSMRTTQVCTNLDSARKALATAHTYVEPLCITQSPRLLAEPLDFTQNHSASRRARPRFLGPTQMDEAYMPISPHASNTLAPPLFVHPWPRSPPRPGTNGVCTRCTAVSTPPDGSRREQLMRRALGCGLWYEDEATRRLCARGRAAAERA